MRKVAIIGGGGVRTPLLIYGLLNAGDALNVAEVVLFDLDAGRLATIERLGRELLRNSDSGGFKIRATTDLKDGVEGADFVLNSIRVGGMPARARDERIAIEHGLAGQETTGPGGVAMGLRTIPVTLAHAKVVERYAPESWFINFTNPAGLITQALTQTTTLRIIGICDTPIELFHRISAALRAPSNEVACEYAGLNHLGWVSRVRVRGADVTDELLRDVKLLREIYPSDLFDPVLIQTLRLLPTEYVFFYYSQQKAYDNQVRAGSSRGEELSRLNTDLFRQLEAEDEPSALASYRSYLRRRNASYMKLEAQGGSAFTVEEESADPFEAATGYHRIALDVMDGLTSEASRRIVLNVRNQGAIEDLEPEDIVEVPCEVDIRGARPQHIGRLPESIRGLVQSVKAYERTLIRASLSGSSPMANLAMLEYPIIGQWELAARVLSSLRRSDPDFLGYLA